MGRVVLCLLILIAVPALADESIATLFKHGTTAMDEGRTEEARDTFARAIQSAPSWGLAYLSYGIAEQTLKPDSEKARNAFEKAVQLEPENPRAHYYLGLAYERVGRFSEAMNQYRQAIAKRPQLEDAHLQLGNLQRLQGDHVGAITSFETLIALEPDNVGALLTAAELYEKVQRFDDAEHALIQVTRLAPTVAYHQYRLAKYYERVGNAPKARHAYARADSLKSPQRRKMRPLLPSK
ncbi:MAG: tetratricopeptide repeat protein [Clostridia bacterium]|nr:tetratricopeptide repeat protein [Deltaproteobacteria bacterium]